MMWWEEEAFLTEKDKEAIEKAKSLPWEVIDENSAETEIGRKWVHDIIMRKYHRDEASAGIL